MIEGMDEVRRNLNKLISGMGDTLEEAATDGALVGERYTKEGAPRDTGKLSRSYITTTESKSANQVLIRTGTDVIYGPFQEFGTSRMPGKPHLRPGFFNHGSEITAAVQRKLEAKIGGL